MSGFFGVVSKKDCVLDLFFGTDYHSHLGTKRGGLAVIGENGFIRSIHNIENSPFRSKFEYDIEKFVGNAGVGCISDSEGQPLLVNSHLGSFAITTVGRINNVDELKNICFERGNVQFLEMSGGIINQTELVAALINLNKDLVSGLRYVQEVVKGSMSVLILIKDRIYAARDKFGRTPVVIGKKSDALCASFESSAYINLGYKDYMELKPGEIVSFDSEKVTQELEGFNKMHICSFLWTYYGYPTSTYEGINVETMRYRCGRYLRKDDDISVDSIAGVPDSGVPHAIGYASESKIPFTRPLIKYTPTWPRSFMPQSQKQRNLIAKMKLITVSPLINKQKLVLIDDSIVRGTQLSETAQLLYENGAKEINVRVACPPIMFGCKYLNFSRNTSHMDLMARKAIAELENVSVVSDELAKEYTDENSGKYQKMVDLICHKMHFDSLKYHKLSNLVKSIGLNESCLCTYCFNGKEE
ncbi:MAG: amidophosphoribosyltransferase [Bacilli bacterium]|nr:amidophosphoribosyltransferase [Bacilli bacterium]